MWIAAVDPVFYPLSATLWGWEWMGFGAGSAGTSTQAGGIGQGGLRAAQHGGRRFGIWRLEFGIRAGSPQLGGAEELLERALDWTNLLLWGRAGAVAGECRDPAICLRPVIINYPHCRIQACFIRNRDKLLLSAPWDGLPPEVFPAAPTGKPQPWRSTLIWHFGFPCPLLMLDV